MKNRKMKRCLGSMICLGLVSVSIMTACSSKSSTNQMGEKETHAAVTEYNEYEMSIMARDQHVEMEAGIADTGSVAGEMMTSAPVDTGKKLIKTVNMSLETKDLDTLLEQLDTYTKEHGGYVEYSDISGDSRRDDRPRSASLTIRIPQEYLDTFVSNTKEAATVTNISNSTVDVTLSYVDIESRKKSLEIEQERLYAILEKAETVEELITVEERLSYVRYELEWHMSSLKSYDNQIDYSTIDIYIREVERITNVEKQGMWGQIATRFSDSIANLINGAKVVFIWFVGGIPYFIIIGAIATAVIVGFKRRKNKKV